MADKYCSNDFFAGNICPDGIMAREGYCREMKLHTHMRDGIPDGTFQQPEHLQLFRKRLSDFFAKHNNKEERFSLYLGYLTHMLTDEKFILENNILTTLFEQEQEQYRKIYSEINKYKQSYEKNSDFGDIQTVIESLKEYVILSFQALRYASRNMSVFNEEYGENEQVLEPSIFKGDNYEKFRETELEIIVSNIGKIQERLFFTNNLECLSAFEKENVIVDISEKRFYGDYAVKQTNKYMNDLKERKKAISEEEYQKEKQQLIEKKYMYYYNYLNSKYNGILQENDIEFFRSIKSFIDYGSETLILDMSSDEIEANIKMNFERPIEILKNDMKIILGPSNKEKTEKDTQKLEQNEEKIDEGVEK